MQVIFTLLKADFFITVPSCFHEIFYISMLAYSVSATAADSLSLFVTVFALWPFFGYFPTVPHLVSYMTYNIQLVSIPILVFLVVKRGICK